VFTVIGLVTIVTVGAIYGGTLVLTMHVDGTVQVDNPQRPPDWVCDRNVGERTTPHHQCSNPREIERSVDAIIWSVTLEHVWKALLSIPVYWFGTGLLLQAGSWLADGENGSFASFGVAAWGTLPFLVSSSLGLVAFHFALDPVTVTGTPPRAAAMEPVVEQLTALQPYAELAFVGTSLWGTLIARYGLEHQRNVSGTAAWLIVTPVVLVTGLVAVL
jgi:hypothetical protein